MLLVDAQGTVSLLLAATAASFWTSVLTSQLIPEWGTTVQCGPSVLTSQLHCPAVWVQFHVARVGARPEKIWIANAPTAAATAFDIMISGESGLGKVTRADVRQLKPNAKLCAGSAASPKRSKKYFKKKKQQVLNSGFVGNQFKQSASRIGIHA